MSAPTITASAPNSTNSSDDILSPRVNFTTAAPPALASVPPSIDTKPLPRHRGDERVDGLSSWSIPSRVTPVHLQNASGCRPSSMRLWYWVVQLTNPIRRDESALSMSGNRYEGVVDTFVRWLAARHL